AEQAGAYQVMVSVPDKQAGTGNYRIIIEQLRAATPEDCSRILAEKATVEGEQLQIKATADSLRQALEKYHLSLPLYHDLGDRPEEATVLDNMGRANYDLGEMEQALECFHQALAILREGNDRQAEASVLNNIGAVYDDLGEKQKALEAYLQV